jgi:predicted DNA-binding mobile mystery protein A
MGRFEHLKIRQVDSALEPFSEIRGMIPPESGWVRTVRESLGMSIRQLAERMNASKTTAATLERNEAAGTIKLRSLQAVSEALGCELVYALVPRISIEETVKGRARLVAERRVMRISQSMELEAQGIPEMERERQIAELAERLWEEMPQKLWDEPR